MPTNRIGTAGLNCIVTRLSSLQTAWEEFSPDLVLAGMTLEDFKAATAASLTIRQQSLQLHSQLRANVVDKLHADRASRKAANQIIAAVKADKNLGPDSPLYRSMGFIPESERKSPKKQKPAQQPKA